MFFISDLFQFDCQSHISGAKQCHSLFYHCYNTVQALLGSLFFIVQPKARHTGTAVMTQMKQMVNLLLGRIAIISAASNRKFEMLLVELLIIFMCVCSLDIISIL